MWKWSAAEAEAGRLRETIVRYTEIAKAIGPDGIRSKMLTTGMGRLNAGLGVLADVAGWPLVVGSLNGRHHQRRPAACALFGIGAVARTSEPSNSPWPR